MNRHICTRCDRRYYGLMPREGGLCYDCRLAIAHELQQLGIPTITANAMARSGRIVKDWREFARYTAESWRGIRSIGSVGRRHIASALALYGEQNPSRERTPVLQCSTCKHWKGVDEDDVADCDCPLPIWALMEDRSIEARSMAGDRGQGCRCWVAV